MRDKASGLYRVRRCFATYKCLSPFIQIVVLTAATDETIEWPALFNKASETLLTDEPRASDRRKEAHAANSASMGGDRREGV